MVRQTHHKPNVAGVVTCPEPLDELGVNEKGVEG